MAGRLAQIAGHRKRCSITFVVQISHTRRQGHELHFFTACVGKKGLPDCIFRWQTSPKAALGLHCTKTKCAIGISCGAIFAAFACPRPCTPDRNIGSRRSVSPDQNALHGRGDILYRVLGHRSSGRDPKGHHKNERSIKPYHMQTFTFLRALINTYQVSQYAIGWNL